MTSLILVLLLGGVRGYTLVKNPGRGDIFPVVISPFSFCVAPAELAIIVCAYTPSWLGVIHFPLFQSGPYWITKCESERLPNRFNKKPEQ